MEVLKEHELSQVLGGGYWRLASDGHWVYIDDDEEPDGDDIIWV